MTKKTIAILAGIAASAAIIAISAFAIRHFTYIRPRHVSQKVMADSTVYTGTIQRRMKQGYGTAVYRDSSVYTGQFNLDRREGLGTFTDTTGTSYEGFWENDMRHGLGTLTKDGTRYSGIWNEDVLNEGRIESKDVSYEGELKDLLPDGFGKADYNNGESYIGNFSEGYKNGLGKLIRPDRSFKFGTWDNGVLKRARDKAFNDGDQIYGIDMSHHQPDIDWDNLTLYADYDGKVFYRKSSGRRNYPVPVSFVFMKATEKDDFIDSDYKKNADLADKHHIIKGAYHFYRYGPSPEDQMKNFIENSRYDEGDLPPVLDVELSIAEVNRAGKENVQKDVLECLKIIERERGVKPILYSGKRTYDAYLDCPELAGYTLWIARYGVSDPNVPSYTFWQWTCYGELGGMEPSSDIDINIFHGDNKDWIAYLEKVQKKKY